MCLLLPAEPVLAQVDNILRGALTGVLNNTIQNEINKPQLATSANTTTSTREGNRQIQMALNHFGYSAGTADGILGPRSRAAIVQFQKSNDYSATGTLTNSQKSALLSNWRRPTSSAPPYGTDLVGTGQLILDNGSISTGRERPKTARTTTARTGITGDTILPVTGQPSQRTRARVGTTPRMTVRTGNTTVAPPVVVTSPIPGTATSGNRTSPSVTTKRLRNTATPTTTVVPRQNTATPNTTTRTRRITRGSPPSTTTVQPAGTQRTTSGSTARTSESTTTKLRCQARGARSSVCPASN
ncbi:hypothetical protein DL239_15845 [Sedimentitalea sp. CY04]|uniref:Peptidoglycan binding-like domain-containing protein n=1 Tax=Parasedimentitalea denitrificans TaxID=2211118 RepID=A0ABX0WDX6_9RHOB|nr:hypothetical protein [Sedimentitalea sp. CY04]